MNQTGSDLSDHTMFGLEGENISRPPVSVVIPVWNGERFLGECLSSVFAQDYRPFEVIVVDDGSTDGTARVAKTFPVRYLYQPNQGPSAARNTGITAARGEYISFFDHDDLMLPHRLRVQAELLATHPQIGLVLSPQKTLCEPDARIPDFFAVSPGFPHQEVVPGTLAMVRRRILDLVGGFDPDLRYGEDSEWLSRVLAKDVQIHKCPEVLGIYRFHGANLTYSHPGSWPIMFKILKRRAAEKRTLNGPTDGRSG